MNEALADFSSISDIETNEDYMPFIHGLTENTVKGDLFVSIFGGGTSKTEYEALTSNSMAFMPKGSTPYVTYINRKTSSLATTLRACIRIREVDISETKYILFWDLINFMIYRNLTMLKL